MYVVECNYLMLFTGRVRVLGFGLDLVSERFSGYAYVSILLSVVIVTLPIVVVGDMATVDALCCLIAVVTGAVYISAAIPVMRGSSTVAEGAKSIRSLFNVLSIRDVQKAIPATRIK